MQGLAGSIHPSRPAGRNVVSACDFGHSRTAGSLDGPAGSASTLRERCAHGARRNSQELTY
jgi:hypothetical protein